MKRTDSTFENLRSLEGTLAQIRATEQSGDGHCHDEGAVLDSFVYPMLVASFDPSCDVVMFGLSRQDPELTTYFWHGVFADIQALTKGSGVVLLSSRQPPRRPAAKHKVGTQIELLREENEDDVPQFSQAEEKEEEQEQEQEQEQEAASAKNRRCISGVNDDPDRESKDKTTRAFQEGAGKAMLVPKYLWEQVSKKNACLSDSPCRVLFVLCMDEKLRSVREIHQLGNRIEAEV
jgi:hypothetical protein